MVGVAVPSLGDRFIGVVDGDGELHVLELDTGKTLLRLPDGPQLVSTIGNHLLVGPLDLGSKAAGAWSLDDLPANPADNAPAMTNYRVCRDDFQVVSVVPFDPTAGPWAPSSACAQ